MAVIEKETSKDFKHFCQIFSLSTRSIVYLLTNDQTFGVV